MSMNVGIIGCGDFLRWQSPNLLRSKNITIKKLFDPRKEQAQHYAEKLNGIAVDSADNIYDDAEIDLVLLFVPPWARCESLSKAAAAGKQVLTTKPLAPNEDDCEAIIEACANIKTGVIYNRTDSPFVETARNVFQEGSIGKLALLKQDWVHHYPKWNNWATDPERNGGPFMDAMIHNLNIARYLLDDDISTGYFSSQKHSHPELACADTEFLKIDSARGASAHLFITWAADLHYQGTSGNDREHINQFFMVTDQGWHCTESTQNGVEGMLAHKHGHDDVFFPNQKTASIFDQFVAHVQEGAAFPSALPSISEAADDIALIRHANACANQCFAWSGRQTAVSV